MSSQDSPTFSEKAEANLIAASLEAKPKKSTPESRAEAKRRKAIKSQPPLASDTPLAESITAPPSANLIAADEEAARLLYVASVQAIAVKVSAELNGFVTVSLRIEEVQADLKRHQVTKATFKQKFTSKDFREECRQIRHFFSTRRVNEFLIGADGITQYSTAVAFFDVEYNVSYEYIRQLSKDGEAYDSLSTLFEIPAPPPKAKKQAAEVDYTEVEKEGEFAEKRAAAETVNPTPFTAVTEEAPVIRTVDAAYDAIVAYSRSASSKLTPYERDELQSRLAAFFVGDTDSHSRIITLQPVEEMKALEA